MNIMKNSMLTLVSCALLLMASCNNIDTKLIEQVQASMNKLQDSKQGLESAKKDVANLQEQMSKAPAGLQSAKEFGFNDLYTKLGAFDQKYSSMQALQDDWSSKLEGLLGDYTDGKIKKEALVAEHTVIAGEIDGIQQSLDRMAPFFNELSAEYAKMTATWQALPEAERLAHSKNAEVPLDLMVAPAGESSISTQPAKADPLSAKPTIQPQTSSSLVKPDAAKKQ